MEYKILQKLCDERIFKIIKRNNEFEFMECCDDFFQEMLTKEEVEQLIKELSFLINDDDYKTIKDTNRWGGEEDEEV